jgi:hypothetical protein
MVWTPFCAVVAAVITPFDCMMYRSERTLLRCNPLEAEQVADRREHVSADDGDGTFILFDLREYFARERDSHPGSSS